MVKYLVSVNLGSEVIMYLITFSYRHTKCRFANYLRGKQSIPVRFRVCCNRIFGKPYEILIVSRHETKEEALIAYRAAYMAHPSTGHNTIRFDKPFDPSPPLDVLEERIKKLVDKMEPSAVLRAADKANRLAE